MPEVQKPGAWTRELSWIALGVLAVGAAVSVHAAWAHVVELGQDMQWSPTVLFLEGINPYAHFLADDPGDRLILEQAPNYAHALYVAMTPLALLPFDQARLLWAVINQVASLLLAWHLGRSAGLSPRLTLALTLAFLCSTPFRTGLANGQLATLTMLAAAAALRPPTAGSAVLVGLSYLKYSFALPMAAWLWWRHGAGALMWSLVPGAVGFGLFLWQVGGSPVEVLLQPLAVNAVAAYGGVADLMTLIHTLWNDDGLSTMVWLEFGLPIVVSLIAAMVIARRVQNPMWALALLSLTSLLCFRHLVYDWIALLPAAACALSRHRHRDGRLVLGLIALHWYGMKLLYVVGVWLDGWPPDLVERAIQLVVGGLLWWGLWKGQHDATTHNRISLLRAPRRGERTDRMAGTSTRA